MTETELARQPFNLTRRFALLSFVTITTVSVALALIVSHFLTHEILDRDALLTAQFVQSLAESEGMQLNLGDKATVGELLDDRVDATKIGLAADAANLARAEFLQHFHSLPDVLLANVFGLDRRIVWSTNPALIGKVVGMDDELDEAFESKGIVARGHIDTRHEREEQAFVGEPDNFFVETYIPLYDRKGNLACVVELYKEPKSLILSIRRGHTLIWASTAAGALLCYLGLFWIVRRASALIADQQRRLVDTETLAVIGEMSSAVAHSIRNPLASIRSSAELGLDGDCDSVPKNLRDIITQVDRIGTWIRDLLVFSRPLSAEPESVELERLVKDCTNSHATQLERAKVSVDLNGVPADLPPVRGSRSLFAQALNSVISNAIEAMPNGGTLRIAVELPLRTEQVMLAVADSGPGLSPQQLEQVFKPFYTTKRNGLGLGLALARRILERFGGTIRMSSREGEGTVVRLLFKRTG